MFSIWNIMKKKNERIWIWHIDFFLVKSDFLFVANSLSGFSLVVRMETLLTVFNFLFTYTMDKCLHYQINFFCVLELGLTIILTFWSPKPSEKKTKFLFIPVLMLFIKKLEKKNIRVKYSNILNRRNFKPKETNI